MLLWPAQGLPATQINRNSPGLQRFPNGIGGMGIAGRKAWLGCVKAIQSRNGLAPHQETFDSGNRRRDGYERRFLWAGSAGAGLRMGWRVLAGASPARGNAV